MAEVKVTVNIDAPIQAVFDRAMAPDTTPDWVTIVLRVEERDPGALREGFTMRQRICLRGVPFTVNWTLTELDAPRFARWEGRGPARSKALIENRLKEVDGHTEFTYVNDFVTPLGPLGAVAGRALMGGIPEREAVASLDRLKAMVEGSAA
jgi:uncharacterized protein YndB with AHSA1/START domain